MFQLFYLYYESHWYQKYSYSSQDLLKTRSEELALERREQLFLCLTLLNMHL